MKTMKKYILSLHNTLARAKEKQQTETVVGATPLLRFECVVPSSDSSYPSARELYSERVRRDFSAGKTVQWPRAKRVFPEWKEAEGQSLFYLGDDTTFTTPFSVVGIPVICSPVHRMQLHDLAMRVEGAQAEQKDTVEVLNPIIGERRASFGVSFNADIDPLRDTICFADRRDVYLSGEGRRVWVAYDSAEAIAKLGSKEALLAMERFDITALIDNDARVVSGVQHPGVAVSVRGGAVAGSVFVGKDCSRLMWTAGPVPAAAVKECLKLYPKGCATGDEDEEEEERCLRDEDLPPAARHTRCIIPVLEIDRANASVLGLGEDNEAIDVLAKNMDEEMNVVVSGIVRATALCDACCHVLDRYAVGAHCLACSAHTAAPAPADTEVMCESGSDEYAPGDGSDDGDFDEGDEGEEEDDITDEDEAFRVQMEMTRR